MALKLVIISLFSLLIITETQAQLTEDEKTSIADYHNTLRGMVVPTASNMRFMTWDPFLESQAATFAFGCIAPRVNRMGSGEFGINLAMKFGTVDYKSEILDWYEEGSSYNYSSNLCDSSCYSYKQMVWAQLDSIGCEAYLCQSLQGFGDNATLFFCFYTTSGNYSGLRPYEAGIPCSNCSSDYPFCENNLCSKVERSSTTTSATDQTTASITTEESVTSSTSEDTTVTPTTEETDDSFTNTKICYTMYNNYICMYKRFPKC